MAKRITKKEETRINFEIGLILLILAALIGVVGSSLANYLWRLAEQGQNLPINLHLLGMASIIAFILSIEYIRNLVNSLD